MTEKEFYKPFRKYELDYKRLKRWYLASLYSYDFTAENIDSNVPREERRNRVYYKDEHLIEVNYFNLLKKYRKNYITFLEEMTLIRIISILENLLLDVIRSSFYYDKSSFFQPKQTIEFQVSEFLSKNMHELEEKFIEEIINNLHRQGFKEIQKFYYKTFKINFNDYNHLVDSQTYSIKSVYKIHDIRHLLVHRLGRTDEK